GQRPRPPPPAGARAAHAGPDGPAATAETAPGSRPQAVPPTPHAATLPTPRPPTRPPPSRSDHAIRQTPPARPPLRMLPPGSFSLTTFWFQIHERSEKEPFKSPHQPPNQPPNPPERRRRQVPSTEPHPIETTVPTVRDRIVQAALKLVLEPILEADFQPCSYGFRPGRRAQDAIAEVHLFTS